MAEGSVRTDGWGRVVDYMFGRNAMIGLASLMLLVISGYATWSGMSDFIVGVQTGTSTQLRDIGGLSVSADALVIAIVVALTFLMWLALRETFGARRRFSERMVTLPLYIFLALWSVGFGYGFWWSLIAGEEATRTGLSGLQEDARDAGATVAARLDAVRVQLDSVVTWSESQMAREESSGGSCGVASGAGRGPLYNARATVRDQIASLRDGVTLSWIQPVQADLEALQKVASGLGGTTVAERQKQFEGIAADIRSRARNIAARSNELGKSTASEMRAIAAAVSVKPKQAGFSCYDPTLAQRLTQAAEQAGEPAVLSLRDAAFNEGPAGVANAVKNLWSNIGSYLTSLVTFVASGGADAGKETAGGEPIQGRDLIALLATLGVDLGLLVLMILNPPATAPLRTRALAKSQARLPELSATVVRQIAGAIGTATAQAPGASLEWVRKHFVHHDAASYFVIPNLHSVARGDKNEELRALAMNQLGGVLSELELVRQLTDSEWKAIRADEARESKSIVSEDENASSRNYGLLSKGRRALAIADWSEAAQKDLEVFRLTQTEGLTPLLTVLNEAIIDQTISNEKFEGDVPRLTHDATHNAYFDALCEGVGLDPNIRPVIEKISESDEAIQEAAHELFKKRPKIETHVLREVVAFSDRLAQTDNTIVTNWIVDNSQEYMRSQLDAAKIQRPLKTYKMLSLIQEDLARLNIGGDAQKTLSEFLRPESGLLGSSVVSALKSVR